MSSRDALSLLAELFPNCDPRYLSKLLEEHGTPEPTVSACIVAEVIILRNHGYYPRPHRGDDAENLNHSLLLLNDLFPTTPVIVLRSFLLRFRKQLDPLRRTIDELCANDLPSTKATRSLPYALTEADLFKSKTTVLAIRERAMSKYPNLWKSSVEAVLMGCNHDFERSCAHLERLSAKGFTRRLLSSIRHRFRGPCEPFVAPTGQERFYPNRNDVSVSDNDAAARRENRKLNYSADDIGALGCQVCLSDTTFEDVIVCGDGHYVCDGCVKRYLHEGLYGSGYLRDGRPVACFASTDCTALLSWVSLEKAIRDDKVLCEYQTCMVERALNGHERFVKCAQCGYLEVLPGTGEGKEDNSWISRRTWFPPFRNACSMWGWCLSLVVLAVWLASIDSQFGLTFGLRSFGRSMTLPARPFAFAKLAGAAFSLGCSVLVILVGIPPVSVYVAGLFRRNRRLRGLLSIFSDSVPVARVSRWPVATNAVLEGSEMHVPPNNPEIPAELSAWECRVCKTQTCLYCYQRFTPFHNCRRQGAMVSSSLRAHVETAMSNAIKHVCPQCDLAFTKSDGCNLIKCTRCSHVLCYVCRKGIDKEQYGHFCGHFRQNPGESCSQCTKCDLFKMKDHDHDLRRRAGVEAVREWLDMFPEYRMDKKTRVQIESLIYDSK